VVLRPTGHKVGNFGDVSPAQSLGLVWKKLNQFTNQKKCTTTQNKHKKTKARFSRLLYDIRPGNGADLSKEKISREEISKEKVKKKDNWGSKVRRKVRKI